MERITFGKNILENLTTAMYSDSRVMFREYVQNSCDAIRSAAQTGIIDRKYGRIDIEINAGKRTIEIIDNGGGISRKDFERVLGDIANSDKQRGEDMGFRGIGRLCGLAYCSELCFISTAYGETDLCTMIWDAGKMRALLEDDEKYSAEYVIDEIRRIKIDENTEERETHFFKVIMTGVESDELLDVSDIKGYLSFVAPVPYTTSFLFYSQIYDNAKSINESIDEYFIFINGEQIFKNYISRTYTKERKVKDDIKSLEFEEFKSENGERLAWMWYGISSFDGSIPECDHNPHRGLRIRKNNIQIDDGVKIRERKLHKEERGNGYFIGEILAVHKDLTPNARRDYFNENSVRAEFEKAVKTYFHQTLYKLYQTASDTRSAYKSVEEYYTAHQVFKEKESTGFSGTVERQQAEVELEKKRETKEKAERKIQKFEREATERHDPLIERVRSSVRERVISPQLSETPRLEASDATPDNGYKGNKPKYLTDELSSYTRETRKVVSRIYDVIQQKAPEIATELISHIQDALKSRKD